MPEDKTCAGCGRRIEWRKKWARDWDAVRWCGEACRRRGMTEVDVRLEETLLALVARSGKGGANSDDAARALEPDDWQPLREPARRAARRLVARGEAELVQGGRVVDPSTATGPWRVRRV